MSLTRLAHELVKEHFQTLDKEGSRIAVDGTCGNGHDTEFLARLGFDKVYSFDVQEQAISNTKERLERVSLTNNVELYQQSHEHIGAVIDGPVSCIMFNFGYLPKADKHITTMAETSLKALSASLEILNNDGLLCFICYPGHPEGKIETLAIVDWVSSLEKSKYDVTETHSRNHSVSTPILYTVRTYS